MYIISTIHTLVTLLPLLTFVSAYSERCPSPLSLCNEREAYYDIHLDEVLDAYFSDPYDTALGGDRELVWWALAGGDEGRWWWDQSNVKKGEKFKWKDDTIIVKRAVDVNSEDAGTNDNYVKEPENETEEERVEREIKEFEEETRREHEEGRNWEEREAGFCCDESSKCLGLKVDRSLVVCFDESQFIVVTAEKVTLNVRTLDFTYSNGTKGNLRDYEVPKRVKGKKYKPAIPTVVRKDRESGANTVGMVWAAVVVAVVVGWAGMEMW
ncbi:hypothetical protein BDZ91DRAFT_45815 [Kalaharituber pfeilii]|nr:hypothetical protein BDZ91DRAFT_45815 [Kalaharituber pfeilii]